MLSKWDQLFLIISYLAKQDVWGNTAWLLISLPFLVGVGVLVKMNVQVAKELITDQKK